MLVFFLGFLADWVNNFLDFISSLGQKQVSDQSHGSAKIRSVLFNKGAFNMTSRRKECFHSNLWFTFKRNLTWRCWCSQVILILWCIFKQIACKFPTTESRKVLESATQLKIFESSRIRDSTDLSSVVSSDHAHMHAHMPNYDPRGRNYSYKSYMKNLE